MAIASISLHRYYSVYLMLQRFSWCAPVGQFACPCGRVGRSACRVCIACAPVCRTTCPALSSGSPQHLLPPFRQRSLPQRSDVVAFQPQPSRPPRGSGCGGLASNRAPSAGLSTGRDTRQKGLGSMRAPGRHTAAHTDAHTRISCGFARPRPCMLLVRKRGSRTVSQPRSATRICRRARS